MLKKASVFLVFLCISHIKGHINFINTTDEHLVIIDVHLKKNYQVNAKQETILLTSAQASHFLIYEGIEETTESQKNQPPLFSFGTVERMQIYPIVTITAEDLVQSNLPENLFVIPSSIKRSQAVSLINKSAKGCSKCEERRKERERLAQQQKQ